MPRLGIEQTLENNLEVIGSDSVERNLLGKGYRITRKQRMENLRKNANQLKGKVQEGPEL